MSAWDARFPRTTSDLKRTLEAAGLRPRKDKGQHFLTDPQAVDAIVRDAEVGEADRVIEVGTGPGLLTYALARTGAAVESFDVDEQVQAFAIGICDWPERIRFHAGDVLETKRRLAQDFLAALALAPPGPSGRRLVVSNLPYNVAAPILLGLLALPDPPDELTVLIQLEMAEKMLAEAGGAIYGVPSVQVGLKASGRILRRFGPQVFWPRPKVQSALLQLVPHRPSPLDPAEHQAFARFVTQIFTRRRKVLPTALRQAVAGLDPERARAALAAQGLATDVRPQAVTPAQMLALFRMLDPEARRPEGE